jgi:elongation factor 1 alpha-like protein
MAPLRIPISNVFKAQGSFVAVSGRLCGGVVQVGEQLKILPGDEIALVKRTCLKSSSSSLLTFCVVIDVDKETVPWAAAGSNVTLTLTAIGHEHLSIGYVLCSPTEPIQVATVFTARIIVFDIQVPVTAGTSVYLMFLSDMLPSIDAHCPRWNCSTTHAMFPLQFRSFCVQLIRLRGKSSRKILGTWFGSNRIQIRTNDNIITVVY